MIFFLMFAIVCLINVDFAILRSMRSTLAVVDLGNSAALIPYFELLGTFPGAVLVTIALAWLMNRLAIHKVFLIAVGGFVLFYTLFAFGFYPFLGVWKVGIQSLTWLPGHDWLGLHLGAFAAMLFYTMAELWKVALLSVLFWGLANQYLSLEEAKRFYAPTILGGSVGAIFAGPLITACTSLTSSWATSMSMMLMAVSILGLFTIWLYYLLWRRLSKRALREVKRREPFSLRAGIAACRNSPYLLLLLWMVCADYIAYALGELIFLEVLRERFPSPQDYCAYMGTLGTWSGGLTALFALFITPWLIHRHRWVVASLVTPILIFLSAGSFFVMVCSHDYWESSIAWVTLTVACGSVQFCLCRAAKYTLFDTAKEIAFIHLPDQERMQGKLVVDGIGSRMGRSGASVLSIGLIGAAGGVLASAMATGLIAGLVALSSVLATWRLGRLVDRRVNNDATN